jgi:hypothetical protein
MRIALMVGVVCSLCGTAFAQENVLDRRIQADTPGAAVIWVPDGIANGMFAWRIAQTGGVPLIFEALPLNYRDPAIVAQRFDLAGRTVREALDIFVAQDPRYRWEERAGVLVIRPIDLWNNPDDVLNQPFARVQRNQFRLDDVLTSVMTAIVGTSAALNVPAPIDSKQFSLDVPSGTVVDVLVAAARAHGASMWSVPDDARVPGHAGFSLGFKTFDGRGAGLTAPIHR